MALIDEVKSRYKTQTLINLTRKDDVDAQTIDDTYLGLAVTDTEATFLERVQTIFDVTIAQHVKVAVIGVVAFLNDYNDAAGEKASARMTRFHDACDRLASATTRARVVPETNTVLIATDTKGDPPRPEFDEARWDHLIPGAVRQNLAFETDADD